MDSETGYYLKSLIKEVEAEGGLLLSNVRFGLMADIQFKFNNGKVGGQQSFGALLANGNCAGQSGHP